MNEAVKRARDPISDEIIEAYTAMRRASLDAEATRMALDKEIEAVRELPFPGATRMAVIGNLTVKKELLLEGLQQGYDDQLKPLLERLKEGPVVINIQDITRDALKAKLEARQADPAIVLTAADITLSHTPFMRHYNDANSGLPPKELKGEVKHFGTYSFVLETDQGEFSVTPVSVRKALPSVEIQDLQIPLQSGQEAA